MKKPARYLLLLCLLAVSVCLLAAAAASGTLGHLWGQDWNFDVPFGHDGGLGMHTDWRRTTLAFNGHFLLLPINNLHLTLASLIGPALVLLVGAGYVARPLFQPTEGRGAPPASNKGGSDKIREDLLHS